MNHDPAHRDNRRQNLLVTTDLATIPSVLWGETGPALLALQE
jgi:hypothetical protein